MQSFENLFNLIESSILQWLNKSLNALRNEAQTNLQKPKLKRVTEYFEKMEKLLIPLTPEPPFKSSYLKHVWYKQGILTKNAEMETYEIGDRQYPICRDNFKNYSCDAFTSISVNDRLVNGFGYNPNGRGIQMLGFENVMKHEEIHVATALNPDKFAISRNKELGNSMQEAILEFIDEFVAYTRSVTLEITRRKVKVRYTPDNLPQLQQAMLKGIFDKLISIVDELSDEDASKILNLKKLYKQVIDRCMQDSFESTKVRQLLVTLRKKADSLEKLQRIGEDFLLN